MESTSFMSHLTIGESIATDPVPPAAFVPNDGNILPKWPFQLDKDSWDEWQFQAMAADGSVAFVVIFFRHTGNAPAGFRVGINASWAGNDEQEEAVWCSPVLLPHSVIKTDSAHGGVTGIWHGGSDDASPYISFKIAADLSQALVIFNVPDKIIGTLTLTSLGYDAVPRTEAEAKFTPAFWWLRPIAIASVMADLTFFPLTQSQNTDESKRNSFRTLQLNADSGAFGTMERAWSTVPPHKCLTHNWWLWARSGPYLIQLIWMKGRPEETGEIWATGRLYHNRELICAPQRAIAFNDAENKDSGNSEVLKLEYLYDEGASGITGAFRLKNIGHRVVFRSAAGDQTWEFESRHVRTWYNLPMTKPGPDATGLSGFVVSVSGGLRGSVEKFRGPGIVGGGIMP